jgi:hypothetical protein
MSGVSRALSVSAAVRPTLGPPTMQRPGNAHPRAPASARRRSSSCMSAALMGLSEASSRLKSVARCRYSTAAASSAMPRSAPRARRIRPASRSRASPAQLRSRTFKSGGTHAVSTKRVTSAAALSPAMEYSPSCASPVMAEGNRTAKPQIEVRTPSRMVGQTVLRKSLAR